MKSELRPHQETALAMLRQSLGQGKRTPMLEAPTGFGKTKLAAAIVHGALRKGNRVIFVVPAISLINQTVQSFWDEGITDIGVLQGQHELTNTARRVQVASVQTLQNRKIPHADLVLVDEAHRWFKFYERWFADWNATRFVGLSATPWTKGLGKFYDDLLQPTTTQKLIDEGWLSDFEVYAPTSPDLSKCRTVAGDYHEGDIADVMDRPGITGDIVGNWIKAGQERPTLCFAVNRAHAKHLQKEFIKRGVCAEYVDAYTKTDEREEIAKRFHDGEVKVICNVGCLTTGVDYDVRCIILARPTKSEMLFVQIIGRGLRTAEGKDHCLIFDHTNTHERLGFVTDIHHASLDDGKQNKSATRKEKETPLPKNCSSCAFLKPAKVHKCPNCGFAPERQPEVEVQEGELEKMRRKKKLNREATPEEKELFYGELKGYAKSQGYPEGWAKRKYKAKYGVWPNKYSSATAIEPTMTTLNFIKHEMIKWAKRKKSA